MSKEVRHKGRFAQMIIYLGKLLRMFVYQNDWKVLPMGALIASLVMFVVGRNLFKTQEGTVTGCFALVCTCIWNGFFNSIQVVCRERNIIKREHRAGLHMSSYIAAHMIYQLILCSAQVGITLGICRVAQTTFPEGGIITPWSVLDIAITMLLITYTADMMSLMVSCIVQNTTTAMTTMPFLLIFQLVFSGSYFQLSGFAQKFSVVTISKWGLNALCAIGNYNTLPMVSLWNQIFKFRNIDVNGEKPLLELIKYMEREDQVTEFVLWSGQYNQSSDYVSSALNVLQCWQALLVLAVIFVVISVIALEFIDRDKR